MDRRVRLTFGPTALAVVFGAIVSALVVRNVLVAGRRPLGWALAAVVAAAALEPVVSLASRKMRRGVALVVTLIPLLALVGLVTWGSVRDLDAQVRLLQRDIPQVAQDISDSERFGGAAQEFALVDKAEDFAANLRRPSSQVGEKAVGGASTWVLTLILTLFALGWGPRFSAAAQRQIRDRERRERLSRVVEQAFERSQIYVDSAVLLALGTGLVAWVAFTLIGLPAPTALALVVGLTSLVPSLGIVVATVPAAVLAGGVVSPEAGMALFIGAVALQVLHRLLLRRMTAGAAHPGAAVIVISFLVGFELYGVGGAIVSMAVATFAVAVLDALAEEEAESAVASGTGTGEGAGSDETGGAEGAPEAPPPAPT